MRAASEEQDQQQDPVSTQERRALAGVARLFGDLLLRELDADRLERLREPELAAQLLSLGVVVPPAASQDDPDELDRLAAGFHSAFLAPDRGGAPLVASLWTEGRYEGTAAARIRALAEAAAVEFDRDMARGAPIDHLGVLLLLWAQTIERAPSVADEIATQHLAWSEAPLNRLAAAGATSFYPSLAGAAAAFVRTLSGK